MAIVVSAKVIQTSKIENIHIKYSITKYCKCESTDKRWTPVGLVCPAVGSESNHAFV